MGVRQRCEWRCFFFNDTATTEIYTLSLHDALPICRAYESIVGFERSLVEEGIILVKFWMHISDEEQMRRFQARETDPLKRWKLTDEDWRNRERNREYDAAAEEMFARTNHEHAPWEIIAAEQKRFARIAVIETLNQRIEQAMK